MSQKIKTILKSVFVLALVALSSHALAVWQAPTATAPLGNAWPPINVSATSQQKTGGLWVGGLQSNTFGVFGSYISAGDYIKFPYITTLPSCYGGIEGAVIYYAVSTPFGLRYCNGSAWVAIGGSSGPWSVSGPGTIYQNTGIKVNIGILTYATSRLNIAASTTGMASLHLDTGTNPSNPQTGDLWFVGAGPNLYFRKNGTTTVDLLATGSTLSGGIANSLTKWTGASTVGPSSIYDNGTNIGIGTTGPASKLQIGSVGVSGYSGNDIAIGNGTQVMALFQSPIASSFYTNTNFAFLAAGGTGNVGIGTTAPAAKLSVVGGDITVSGGIQAGATSYFTTLQITGGTPGVGKVLTSDAVGLASWQTGGGTGTVNYVPKWISASTLGNSSIFDNGNVGIGTTTPLTKLDVAGNILATGIQTGTGSYLATTSGNVGIGTTNPANKLDVVGNANISGAVTASTISATSVTATNIVASTTLRAPGLGTVAGGAATCSLDGLIGYGYDSNNSGRVSIFLCFSSKWHGIQVVN